MNYYELIYLKTTLKNKMCGGYIELALTPFKNFIEFFVINSESKNRLLFSVDPGNNALFEDSYRAAKKGNTTVFFESLYGLKITDIHIPESDRWLYIHLEGGFKLVFRLFSNKANVFLTKDDIITETFKEYDTIGNRLPEPKKIDLFSTDITGKEVKNKILGLNPMFPREHLAELIQIHSLIETTDAALASFVKAADKQLRDEAVFRLLKDGKTTLFSEQILPIATERLFDDINALIAYRYKNYSHDQRLHQQKSDLINRLNTKIKKLSALDSNLEKNILNMQKADKYEQWGHLLMANAHVNKSDNKSIVVDNVFEEGQKEEIKLLKKDAAIAENAQHYYKKAQNIRQTHEQAKKQLPQIKRELEGYRKLQDTVENISGLWEFQDWLKENQQQVQEFIKSSEKRGEQHLPFHVLQLKEYTVWIGKNAKSNDKLLQLAHKEDIWMHARGVAGSHLVIRMGNEKNMPPKEVILRAASYAAFNSKGKGSDLVPVIVTKMKYVRKPKGAAPGAVLVDKEEVEMVSPEKPDH